MPDCPGDVKYTSWSAWSACSVSCSNGVQTKTRYCSTDDGCAGSAQETKECLLPPCPGKINIRNMKQLVASRAVARALIGGGGGGVYSYIRILPD